MFKYASCTFWLWTLFLGLCLFGLSCGINGAEKVTVAVLDFDIVNSNGLPEDIRRTVPEWLERHTTAVFNNKLWVIGGYSGGLKNDVWSMGLTHW